MAEMWRKKIDAMKERERTRTMNGSLKQESDVSIQYRLSKRDIRLTLCPGESSVYSLSMVFEDPPAPAARVELGLET